MKYTTVLLLLGTISAIKINEAPAKEVESAAAAVKEVAPETNAKPAAAESGNDTKPLTKAEIKAAAAEVAWAKYKVKKANFDEYIEEANLEGWRQKKNGTAAGMKRYKEMTAGIKADNDLEINSSKAARAIVGGNASTEASPDVPDVEGAPSDTKDEKWVYKMPVHVVKATKGPSENVTTAKIATYPGF